MSKKRKSSFKGKVAEDARRQQQAASSYGYLKLPQGVTIFNPDVDSKVLLDFIPYEVTDPKHPDRDDDLEKAMVGDLWYKRPFWIHRNVGAGKETVVCPSSIGKRCPICEYQAKRRSEGADKEEIGAMKRSLRNLYIVIPIEDKKFEHEVHVWDMSQYLFQKQLNIELQEDDDYEMFPDLEDGWTLKVRFEGKTIGKGEPFADTSRIDFEERPEPYSEDILDEVPNLDEMLTILTSKQLEAMFFEMEVEEEPEDEVTAPTERKRKTTDKEEEEEEKEKPTRRSRKDKEEEKPTRRSRKDKDEDEEEKPTRRSRKDKDEDECPHGHTFGKDCEEYDECDDCDLWDKCIEAKEAG
jgi:hypothetical protein